MSNKSLSWNAEKIRDAKSPVPDKVHASSSKNTRRWCRGKQGIEHNFVWRATRPEWQDDPTWPWERQVCQSCGRHGKVRRNPDRLHQLTQSLPTPEKPQQESEESKSA